MVEPLQSCCFDSDACGEDEAGFGRAVAGRPFEVRVVVVISELEAGYVV